MMTKAEAVKWLESLKQEIGKTENRSLWHYAEAIDMVIEAMSEPKTGEWIEVTNGRGGHECSNCHGYAPSYMNGDEHLSDFCPNCGAKMEDKHE